MSAIWLATIVGVAVSVAWFTLLAWGRWCAEPTWTDRVGRAFGFYWIIVGMAMVGMPLLDDGAGAGGVAPTGIKPTVLEAGAEADEVVTDPVGS